MSLTFRVDDLTGATQALIRDHLAGMHRNSPPGACHAFDLTGLRQPSVTVWTAWWGEALAGCGALHRLDARRGELKTMRVADAFLGQGIGRALLEHLVGEARREGLESLWLETGRGPAFDPATTLYLSAGFERCGPFGDYVDDGFSVFMTRALCGRRRPASRSRRPCRSPSGKSARSTRPCSPGTPRRCRPRIPGGSTPAASRGRRCSGSAPRSSGCQRHTRGRPPEAPAPSGCRTRLDSRVRHRRSRERPSPSRGRAFPGRRRKVPQHQRRDDPRRRCQNPWCPRRAHTRPGRRR
ncbi:MAG: GNAT family N-acetyltransferase [Myxococcaceae bacterium]|nr:GNAT family N-acetyltransferase [Myxococcaceae bacterium]